VTAQDKRTPNQIAISKGMKIHWKKRRASKYNAVQTTVDGITFHSKGEAFRWMELKLLERAGKITELRRQVELTLHAHGFAGAWTPIGKYVADFSYREIRDLPSGSPWTCQRTYEDFKGFDVPLGKWKRKHAEAEYGIKILLTGPAAKRRKK
jgi:hypothetical protein